MGSIEKTTAMITSIKAKSEQDLRCPCYCEENVWRLAYRRQNPKDYVVFVSNDDQCCLFYNQKANPSQACFWDYHVILMHIDVDSKVWILDMDSTLPYPCPFKQYIEQSFRKEFQAYLPKFRIIQARDYLEMFYSDRMHMFNEETGLWNTPPPKQYDCIMDGLHSSNDSNDCNSKGSNLYNYIHMSCSTFIPKGTTIFNFLQAWDKMGLVLSMKDLILFVSAS